MVFKSVQRTLWSVSRLKKQFEDNYIAKDLHSPFTFLGLKETKKFQIVYQLLTTNNQLAYAGVTSRIWRLR